MTAQDIIKAALQYINSYQSGEQLASTDANDALAILNDLLDSWSTQKDLVYCANENIFNFTANQYQYLIGPGGDFQVDSITGAGVYRPLRVTSAFTRFSGLDFNMEVTLDETRYNSILLKNQPAPWPLVCWYNPTMPQGTLNFYPAPSAGAQLFLFSTTILTNFLTLNQTVTLPQGYARALKWNLAQEICGSYGFPITPQIERNARDSLMKIKSLNEMPAVVSQLDDVLSRGNQGDASWIMTGGFR